MGRIKSDEEIQQEITMQNAGRMGVQPIDAGSTRPLVDETPLRKYRRPSATVAARHAAHRQAEFDAAVEESDKLLKEKYGVDITGGSLHHRVLEILSGRFPLTASERILTESDAAHKDNKGRY